MTDAQYRGVSMNRPKPKSGLVNAPATAEGPTGYKEDEEFMHNPKNRAFENLSNRSRGFWQTLFFAPWNRPAGMGPDASPSFATTIVALLLTFVSSLTYGWVMTTAIDNMLAGGGNIFNQAVFLGFVGSLMFALAMLWSWEPLLPTHVFWGMLTAQVGTLDLGILPWLLSSIFLLGGHAAGGAIAGAIGLQQGATPSVMPMNQASGYVLYWFAGGMIIFAYIFFKKFSREYDGEESKGTKDRRAILVATLALFLFTVTFRRTGSGFGLYYFDSGPYLAGLVASGLGDVTVDSVVDWAFYIFVPLASFAFAFILYRLVLLGRKASDDADMNAANMGHKASYH